MKTSPFKLHSVYIPVKDSTVFCDHFYYQSLARDREYYDGANVIICPFLYFGYEVWFYVIENSSRVAQSWRDSDLKGNLSFDDKLISS